MKDSIKLALYIPFHPADGFYEMKGRNRGKVSVGAGILLLLWVSYSFNKQYSSFIINMTNPNLLNSLTDLMMILLVVSVWCAANWAVTTLMDGKGRLKDIFLATTYSMTPIVLTLIPATILSNFLAESEMAFYGMIVGISVAWFVFLLFCGIWSIHDYTFTGTLITIFLTFICILILIFLGILIISTGRNVYTFFESIVTELTYRS